MTMNRWDTYFAEGRTFQPCNEIFLDHLLYEVKRKIGRTPKSVIDLGCGDGDAVIKFGRRGLKTLGIDGSKTGLEIASSAITNAGLPNASVKYSDLENLSGLDASDIVFCRLTFAFVVKKEKFITMAKSFIAKGGVLILITPVTSPGINYSKMDKPGIAVDFAKTHKLLSQHFPSVAVWHHNYFADHGDTATFIAT